MVNTENFSNLPIEKQNAIVDAAFSIFGRNGYKKASVNDIALAAGISKASLFYYFGSKKGMYFYLAEVCVNLIINDVNRNTDNNVTNFFDRIKTVTEIKMSVLKKHPSMLSFLKSLYYETDIELEDFIAKLKSMSESFSGGLIFNGTDTAKFKDDVDPKIIFKFLILASEGFASGLTSEKYGSEIDTFISEFYILLEMMKNNFYKAEYL